LIYCDFVIFRAILPENKKELFLYSCAADDKISTGTVRRAIRPRYQRLFCVYMALIFNNSTDTFLTLMHKRHLVARQVVSLLGVNPAAAPLADFMAAHSR